MTTLSACLTDPESYLYISAIQALAALGDTFPTEIIPKLMSELKNTENSYELQLKIGEVLMHVIRQCGKAAPKYAHLFMPGILQVLSAPRFHFHSSFVLCYCFINFNFFFITKISC